MIASVAAVVAVVAGFLLLVCAIVRLCSFCRRRSPAQEERQGAGGEAENKLVFHTAECSVCLDHFENNQQVVRLNCGHVFHEDCIRSCLRMRNACPLCNTGDARAAMQNVQVALVNDPNRLHEVGMYIEKGAIPLARMYNASLLLTKDGRQLLIELSIRRSLFRFVYNRYHNAGRGMKFLITIVLWIAADLLARPVNLILQRSLEYIFTNFGSLNFLNFCENLGALLQPLLLWPLLAMILVLVCVSYRARTINPTPLMGEFRPENTYIISGQNAGQAAIEEDVTKTEGMTNDGVVEVQGTASEDIAEVTEADSIPPEKERSCCFGGCYTMFTKLSAQKR